MHREKRRNEGELQRGKSVMDKTRRETIGDRSGMEIPWSGESDGLRVRDAISPPVVEQRAFSYRLSLVPWLNGRTVSTQVARVRHLSFFPSHSLTHFTIRGCILSSFRQNVPAKRCHRAMSPKNKVRKIILAG